MPIQNPSILIADEYESRVAAQALAWQEYYRQKSDDELDDGEIFSRSVGRDYPPLSSGRAYCDAHIRAIANVRAERTAAAA